MQQPAPPLIAACSTDHALPCCASSAIHTTSLQHDRQLAQQDLRHTLNAALHLCMPLCIAIMTAAANVISHELCALHRSSIVWQGLV